MMLDVVNSAGEAWTSGGWAGLGVIFAVLLVTYTIFSMMGFGSAVIAAPLLATKLPLTVIVPFLSVLDLTAALINTRALGQNVEKRELLLLAPLMACGSAFGIFLLMSMPAKPLMFGLGAVVIAYSFHRLFTTDGSRQVPGLWGIPFGLAGGLLGGMFGSGGFVFSIYLSHRLTDKLAVRATMTAMTALSTLFRASVFLCVGAYGDAKLIALIVFGLPALALGLFFGHRITLRISHKQFLRILCLLLIATGSSLIWRAIYH